MAGRKFEGYGDKTAIAKRLRHLSSRFDNDARRVYAATGVKFEQRWFGLLNHLVLNGPASAKDIAQALRVTHVSVSEAQRSLETAGYIRTKTDPADKRRKTISLTRKGTALLSKLEPVWRAMEDVTVDLNKETKNVIEALDRLDAALERKSLFERTSEKLSNIEIDE